ncbi:MAG: CRISPR-associated protein Csx19 [Ruminococcus sp.]
MTDKKYISEKGSVDTELNSFIESKIQGGTMIIMTTEKFECCTQKKIEDTEHLLELRVFTESKELKILRPTIADKFTYRIIEDDCKEKYGAIEEEQFLDIDTTKSKGGCEYTATGGGHYSLPIENAEKVRIRNYISYDNQGIAQITDFRVVKFLKGGEK